MTRTLVRLLILAAARTSPPPHRSGPRPRRSLVGASKVNIEPRPNGAVGRSGAERGPCELGIGLDPLWVTNTRSVAGKPELHLSRRLRHRPDERATSFDPNYGLWVRSG